jgi:anti-sigma regulatory factor (Ser/Thr protein kinase)
MKWSEAQIAELLARAADAQHEAGALCASARTLLNAAQASRTPRHRSIRRCYPARTDAVSRSRAAVARLAAGAGIDGRQLEGIRLAVSAAVTKAVVQAYRGSGGYVHLTATLAGGELIVRVADDGCGLRSAPASAGRGWGWRLIADHSDQFTITEQGTGDTQVEIRWRLASPAATETDQPSALSPAVQPVAG